MARSRDLLRRHRLDFRDTVQIWVLSLLAEAPLLAVLLLLSPSVKTMMESVVWMSLILGAIVTTDLLTTLLVALWKVVRKSL